MKPLPMVPLLLLCVVSPLPGQRILYDSQRDRTAQDAANAVKQVSSGALFESMLRNAARQAEQAAQVQAGAEAEASRSRWSSIRTWSSTASFPCSALRCQLEAVERRLSVPTGTEQEVEQRLKELGDKRKLLLAAISRLRAAAKDPDVAALIDQRLGQLDSMLEFANSFAKSTTGANSRALGTAAKAVEEIRETLEQTSKLIDSVRQIWDTNQAVSVDPWTLRPARERIDLQLLEVDAELFRRLGLIRARRHLLTQEAQNNINGARELLQAANLWDSTEEIGRTLETLAAGDRAALERTLRALQLSAAALAVGSGIARVTENQESFERRAAAIRRKAIESAVYEQTLQAASQRLAAYWKAGLKPAEIAQLLFHLTSAASLPVLAGK